MVVTKGVPAKCRNTDPKSNPNLRRCKTSTADVAGVAVAPSIPDEN